jgi:hypothetical protein
VRRVADNQGTDGPSRAGLPADAVTAIGLRVFVLAAGVPAWVSGAPLVVKLLLAVPAFWVAFESAWTYSVSQRLERRRMRSADRWSASGEHRGSSGDA